MRGALIVALAIAFAGCGGKAHKEPFPWLVPASAPAGWHVATIANGAQLAYPSHWRRIHGDPGTATAALLDARHRFRGYLNATPRQGAEALPNWREFRVDHNHDEGDRDVRLLAARSGLRFLAAHGSCVQDSYATGSGARYVEIACLVVGARASSVIVGAAPPQYWSAVSPDIKRAIVGFRT